ncbi:MAG: tetratricopeptide repeat protein [Gammaproteobacteria bacterium]|nr:tetratricopeptide repeat protein [Gammaproteobacteria bacterium]
MKGLVKVIVLSLGLGVLPVTADQNNPELERLFDSLHHTDNPTEAAAITQKIWENWYQTDNQRVEKLMALGDLSMRRGKLSDAVDFFSEIIELQPDYAEGWNRRATAYYMLGEYQLSTNDVAQTLQREPRHFGALSGQGMIYMQLQEKERALEFYEKALEVNPHMSGVQQNIRMIRELIQDEVI